MRSRAYRQGIEICAPVARTKQRVRRLWRVSVPETTPEATATPSTPVGTSHDATPKPTPPAAKPSLPVTTTAAETAVTSPAGVAAKRVVVAEDEALIRLDIVEMLRENGFDVVGEAGDGEQAVQLAEELRPDLVVLDVKMPVLDGISAAERIVGARIAPVVLLTAFSQRELVERARDAGAMAYVVKPFTSADLMPALEIALSRHAEIAALESEVADLQQRFETRKVVDRAKGLLQTRFGMTEPEAFRWIQKTSMDKRLTMREVAQAVIGAGDDKPSS
jgi:AmiR/NasT family two-component response regulator